MEQGSLNFAQPADLIDESAARPLPDYPGNPRLYCAIGCRCGSRHVSPPEGLDRGLFRRIGDALRQVVSRDNDPIAAWIRKQAD
jgi:hypothetical protein